MSEPPDPDPGEPGGLSRRPPRDPPGPTEPFAPDAAEPAYPAEPEAPPMEEGPSTVEEPPPLPTARELISVGLELALRASRSIRNASMAIGFQLLAAAGPLVLLLIIVAAKAPTALDGALSGVSPASGSREEAITLSFGATFFVALLALAALAVESRIVAASLLGAAAGGHPIAPREALRRSRQVFWRVIGATILIQVPLTFASYAVEGISSPILGGSPEAVSVLGIVVTTILTVPFAYILTGIVLGDASATEAIRRSMALARVRWRLALVAAIADALSQTLLFFGLGAGLEIVGSVAAALGLGVDRGPVTTFVTIVLALLGTAAVGSLLFTVAAIAAAPQVVAFVGLTRYTAGIDGARDGPGVRRAGWVSVPMAAGIALALLSSVFGVSAAMRPG